MDKIFQRIRYAKSETKTQRGRGATIAQRWSDVGVVDRRVHLCTHMRITEEDFSYISEVAKDRKESRSRTVERMIWGWYSKGLWRYLPWYPPRGLRLPKIQPSVRMPKFTVHPCTIALLREIAVRYSLSLSATLYLVVRLHRVAS